jgi:hypothetical protein
MKMTTKERPLVTEEERQRLYLRMEQLQPELWSKLYPRHYPEPPTCGEYYAAEDPAHFFLWQYHRADHDVGVAEQPLMTMATTLMNCGVAMAWLSPSIVEAILHTRPPANLDWTTMALPHAAMVLMLPRGTIVHPTEGDVRFIAYNRVGYVDPDGHVERVFSYVPYTRQYPALIQLTDPIVPFATIATLGPAKDRGIQRAVCHLLFNALLIMVSRPELLKESRLISELPEERGSWSCSMLGEHYQIEHKR